MNLGAPLWFLTTPLLAVMAVGLILAGLWYRRRFDRAFPGTVGQRLLPGSVRLRRALISGFALTGLVLGGLAMTQPRGDKQLRVIKAKGVDLIVAVDLSQSMDCRDVDPSRLGRAKREIEDLLAIVEGDRVGLVIFAGGAYPRLPLTQDYRLIKSIMDELDTSVFEAQGSNIGEAIRMSMTLLDGDESKAGKGILLLSDGESHDSGDALVAASEAAAAGVTVYGLGIGFEPSPIPTASGRWVMENGQRVSSVPNLQLLQDLARATGGAYAESVASDADVRQLYQGEMRSKLKSVENRSRTKEEWTSLHVYLLWPAFAALVMAAWLGEGRRAFGTAAALLLAVSLAMPGVALAGTLAEADQLYTDGKFPEAVKVLTELAVKSPDNPEVWQRLGAARYRSNDWEGARRAWEHRTTIDGGSAETWYNLGNSQVRSGRLEEALHSYDEALARRPDHEGAQKNRGLTDQEIVRRRQIRPPPPPQPEPQPGKGQGKPGENGEQKPPEGDPGDPGQEPDQKAPGQDSQTGAPSDSSADSDQQGKPPPPSKGSPENGENRDRKPGDQATDQKPEPREGAELGDVQAENGSQTPEGQPQQGAPKDPNVAKAEQTLDDVKEGIPRVHISGGAGGKPW